MQRKQLDYLLTINSENLEKKLEKVFFEYFIDLAPKSNGTRQYDRQAK